MNGSPRPHLRLLFPQNIVLGLGEFAVGRGKARGQRVLSNYILNGYNRERTSRLVNGCPVRARTLLVGVHLGLGGNCEAEEVEERAAAGKRVTWRMLQLPFPSPWQLTSVPAHNYPDASCKPYAGREAQPGACVAGQMDWFGKAEQVCHQFGEKGVIA